MTAAAAAPSPAVRTFQPIQRVVAVEVHGARAAAKLECGHVADAPAKALAVRCSACHPIEVLRGS